MKYTTILLIFAQSCICHQLYNDNVEKNKIKLNVQSIFINKAACRYSLYDKNEWFKDKKYDESVFKVMACAISDFVTEDNEYKDYRKKEVITFNVEPTKQDYTQANYNALFFYNYIRNKYYYDKDHDFIYMYDDIYAYKKTNDALIKHYNNVQDIETRIKTAQQQIEQYVKVFFDYDTVRHRMPHIILNIMRGYNKKLHNNPYVCKHACAKDGAKFDSKFRCNEIFGSISLYYDGKFLRKVDLGKIEGIQINKSVNEIDSLYDVLNEYNIKHNIIIRNGITLLKSYENKYEKHKQDIKITDEPYEIVFKGAADTDNPFLEFVGDYQYDILTIKTKKILLKDIPNNARNIQKLRLIIPEKTYGHRTRFLHFGLFRSGLFSFHEKQSAEVYSNYYSEQYMAFHNLDNYGDSGTYLQYEIEIKFDEGVYFESNMEYFFRGSAITRIDMQNVKRFEESSYKVQGMFQDCTNLTEIVFPKRLQILDSMDGMFENCKKLKMLDVGSFNTKNATSMRNMFRNCHSLQCINNLEKFDTHNVVSMQSMFENCYSLKRLNIKNFSSKSLQYSLYMFKGCRRYMVIKTDDKNKKFQQILLSMRDSMIK